MQSKYTPVPNSNNKAWNNCLSFSFPAKSGYVSTKYQMPLLEQVQNSLMVKFKTKRREIHNKRREGHVSHKNNQQKDHLLSNMAASQIEKSQTLKPLSRSTQFHSPSVGPQAFSWLHLDHCFRTQSHTKFQTQN